MSSRTSDVTGAVPDGAFSVAEAPDWAVFDPFRKPADGPPPESLIDRGRCFWLAEKQASLDGCGSPTVVRTVQEVTSPEGLQEAAVFALDFNPDYERLVLHALTVTRGEEVRSFADTDYFSVFRREKDLDRAIYDGCLTAHIAIPDVRVGDILEIRYSMVGENPVLRGRVSVGYPLQWGCPVGRAWFRVLAPSDRPISVRRSGRTGDPEISELAGYRDYRWVAHDVPAQVTEDDTPSWWEGCDGVSVGDVMTWSEVSDLFRPGYAKEPALPVGLDKTIAAIGLRDFPPARQVAEALRLVQGSLRYQAINLGVGGFVPRSVEHIWASRAGDCKDASRLLAAILDALGIDAVPALVSTDRGWTLGEKPPWATAFNHCIVRVRLDGETYWLDPTRARQEGRLDR